jgi:hypothetical protein
MKHYFRCLVGIAAVLMLALSMGCSHHNAEEEENSEWTGRYEAKVVGVMEDGNVATDAVLLPNGKKPGILTRVYFNKSNLPNETFEEGKIICFIVVKTLPIDYIHTHDRVIIDAIVKPCK